MIEFISGLILGLLIGIVCLVKIVNIVNGGAVWK